MTHPKKVADKPRSRPTIGEDPLDSLIPAPVQSTPTPAPAKRAARPRPVSRPAKTSTRKVRATFHIPAELFEEARNAVVHLAGPPIRLTLAALAEAAFRRELDHLKKAHNSGKPFPPRTADLRGGRPVGS